MNDVDSGHELFKTSAAIRKQVTSVRNPDKNPTARTRCDAPYSPVRQSWGTLWVVCVIALCYLMFGCRATRDESTPAIEFTTVPLASEGGPDRVDIIAGRVIHARRGERIVIFAHWGPWWVQPRVDQPFTTLEPNSTWRTSTHLGTQYAALLVDPSYQPPANVDSLPTTGLGVVAIAVVRGRPVFWQTWWFLFAATLTAAAIVAAYFRYHMLRLSKDEERFREAIDTIPAMTFAAGPNGSNIFVNKRWIEYAGLTVEQTSGAGWERAIHPDDLAGHSEKWRVSVLTGQLFEDEARFRRSADEEYRWFLVRGVPMRDRRGKIIKWYGTLTDIEDRKRVEEALQSMSLDLQESRNRLTEAQRITHAGYWVWNLGMNSLMWSDETYRIFGLQPQERPIDVPAFQAMIHPEDREFWMRTTQEALRGQGQTDLEFRIIRPTGEVRTVISQGGVKTDASGNPHERFGTLQDITDRKRAEQALQILSRDMQESNARLEEAQRITHVGYWERDLATDRITWSDETYRIYGLRPQEDPIDLAALRQKIHPEDWKLVSQALDEALAGGPRYNIEYRVLRPTGEIRIVHSTGDVKKDASGRPYKMFGTVQDITDRKRAEEALQLVSSDLQDSKAKLEEAQRIAHVGYWEWDLPSNRVIWSDETYRIYGLRPQEFPIDITVVRRMIHPEDLEVVFRVAEEAVRGGLRTDVEHRIIRPSGEQRTVRSQGDVKKDASGRPSQMFGTVQDITERKRAEETLRQNQFYLAEGQRLAHMGSWAFNPAGFFYYWSEELFRIYGLDPQKGAPTLEQYLATVHSQDRDFMANTIKRMLAERSGCDVKKRIVRPDGEQRYIRCVGIPVVEGTVLKGFLGTAIDITEQEVLTRELERRQAHLTEAQKLTHTGSWAWRLADRKAVHLSEEWYRIYALDPTVGAPTWEAYFERVHPEDRLKLQNTIERAIVEKADYDLEFRILLPNGMVKWIHTVGHPIFSGSGELEQFVGSSTDITEHKSAEQEREKLRELEADLAHIDRVSTLGEMAASLAHEIKQPIAAAITSANSCVEWLAHEPPNLDRARAAAARIDKYGNRAAEIIDRIRSFYRKSPPQRELVDVNGIIDEMLSLLKGEAHRFSVAMRTELAAELPKINADRVQLQQVFMNLMLNAIEAMKDSGGELGVKSHRHGGQLQVSISDTGVGLPTEKMDQIFSAFFTTKPRGSGMGLAISRSIVESHGGRLWASANSEGGSTFHFTLPIQVTESSPLVV